ncbi:type II toxin-antitoxin system HipA family toxin [Azospirillum sp. SYSU D00513]|uniref:type II toxin-antitoxin system HipA family toxin n=1 Tax=Azospirillum sp. SYSU D00513 TaxID=2812561 RepID=UPI001A975DBC|nr:type II toxin-antitoxin system HipA family toxin [Azospirillum sp. SYSU D00513]
MTARLDITYDGHAVGVIERHGPGREAISFAYSPAWLSRPGAFPISTRMPLRAEAFGSAATYIWFLNLLPEGNDLPLVGRHLGVSHVDVFGLLERLGADVAGALSIHPPGPAAEQRARYKRLDEADLVEVIRRLEERPLLAGDDGIQMSLAGAQSKVGVAKAAGGGLALPLGGAPSTFILKPAIRRFYGSTENEHFCLSLAREIGLDAARSELGIAGDEPFLLVRRYDRARQEGGIARLHQEDFCQACERPPYAKYEKDKGYGRGPGIADLFAVLDRVSTDKARDRLALRDAIIFNVLIDNVDAHAKNYSLLIGPGNAVRLAPLYDLMCGAVCDGVTRNLAMTVAGSNRGDHIYGRHWDRLATAVGFAPLSLRKRVAALAGLLPAAAEALAARILREEAGRFPVAPEILDQITGVIKARCSRVLINLRREPPPSLEEDEEMLLSRRGTPQSDLTV